MTKNKPIKKTLCLVLAVIMSLTLVTGGALAANWDLAMGDVVVVADATGQKVSGFNADENKLYGIDEGLLVKENETTIITQSGTGATENTITLKSTGDAEVDVTLQDVNIDAPDVKLNEYYLQQGRYLASSSGESAVTVEGKANITIDGDVTLSGGENPLEGLPTSGDNGYGGAGIEVNAGSEVTIKGDAESRLTATGGNFGAGIGSAYDPKEGEIPDAGKITIESGTVNAQGGHYAAGIGGSQGTNGGETTINGANTEVNATGGYGAAGIGGGTQMPTYKLDENGNRIVDEKGLYIMTRDGGNGGKITINDGTVNAQGGELGAGIGSGDNGAVAYGETNVTNVSGGEIIINDGKVTAVGGYQGAGIGGGNHGDGGKITINNGTVHASTSEQYITVDYETGDGYTYKHSHGAGIGGGTFGDGGEITINNGDVTAIGGGYSAGVGGATDDIYKYGNGNKFTMNDGKLTAVGGYMGTAIGSSISGRGGEITINGGSVLAIAGDRVPALGNGYKILDGEGPATTITIGENATLIAIGSGGGGQLRPDGTWAIDLEDSDTTGVKNVINGRFRDEVPGLDLTKPENWPTQLTVVDENGNEVVFELDEVSAYLWDMQYLYLARVFAVTVPGNGEYKLKDSSGYYNNWYTDYLGYDEGVLADERTEIYMIIEKEMLNADDIVFVEPPAPPPVIIIPTPEPEPSPEPEPPEVIPEPDVPLEPEPEPPVIEIEDPDYPLDATPKTGEAQTQIFYLVLLAAAFSLIGLLIAMKKKLTSR